MAMVMKAAAVLGMFFAVMSSVEAQPDLSKSLGAQLVAAVIKGDAAKTRELLGEWKATGKPWPAGPDNKPLLLLAIEGQIGRAHV